MTLPEHNHIGFPSILKLEGYDQHKLLDGLIRKLGLKNDAALARMLHIAPPIVSKLRHRKIGPSAEFILRVHEVTGMSIRDIRKLMGIRESDII